MAELPPPPRESTDLRAAWDRDRPDLQYLVPELIGLGEMCLLVGAPESGKTMLLTAIAASVATGKEILPGVTPTVPARVLYLDEELGEYEFVRRLRKLTAGMCLDSNVLHENLLLFPQQGYSLHTEERNEEFHRSVAEFDPSLIIIDTFVSVYGGDENDNSAVRSWFDRVISPLRRDDRSVVISHHLNKEKVDDRRSRLTRIRGATDLRSYPDKVWFAEKTDESFPFEEPGLTVRLHTVKARRGDFAHPLVTVFSDSPDRRKMFVADMELTPEAAEKFGKKEVCKRAILERLRLAGGSCARTDLLEAIPSQVECSTKTLKRALDDLKVESRIRTDADKDGLVTLI